MADAKTFGARVVSIGNALALVLPDEIAARLGLTAGQDCALSESLEGFVLSTAKPGTEQRARIAEASAHAEYLVPEQDQ